MAELFAFDAAFYLKKLTQFEALGQGIIKFCEWLWNLGGRIVRNFCKWFFGMRYGTDHKELTDEQMDEMEPLLTDILERIAQHEEEVSKLTRHKADADRQKRAFESLGEKDLLENACQRSDALGTRLDEMEVIRAQLDQELAGVKVQVEANKAEQKRKRYEAELKAAAEEQTARDMAMYEQLKQTALKIELAYDHKAKVEDCLEAAVFENEEMNRLQASFLKVDEKTQKNNYDKAIKQVIKGKEAALFERALDCIRCRHVTPGRDFGKLDEAARQATLIDFCAKYRLEEVTSRNVIKFCLGVSAVPEQWEIDNIVTMYSKKALWTRAVVDDARASSSPWSPDF